MKIAFEEIMIDCKGIELSDVRILSESEVTLEDQRHLKRWDLDYMSDAEEGDPTPTDAIDIS